MYDNRKGEKKNQNLIVASLLVWYSYYPSSVPSLVQTIIIRHGSPRRRPASVHKCYNTIIIYLYYIRTGFRTIYIHCILNIISNLSTINTRTRLSDLMRFGRQKVKEKFKNTVTVLHVRYNIYYIIYKYVHTCGGVYYIRLNPLKRFIFLCCPWPRFDRYFVAC